MTVVTGVVRKSAVLFVSLVALSACWPEEGGGSYGDSCTVDGVTYASGEEFPSADGCNTCLCDELGEVVCTEVACAPSCAPDEEWYRDYVATDAGTCAVIKFTCPEGAAYFSNDCGCGCEQSPECPQWFNCMPGPDVEACDPGAIAAKCPYSTIAW